MKTRISTLVAMISVLILSACQAAKPAALTDDQVVPEVSRFLAAVQAGDYQAAVSNFSDTMKGAYSEAQFTQLHDLLQKASGDFRHCSNEKPSLSNSQGYAVYHLTCQFDKEDVAVTITFKIGGSQVEGLYFTSVNLVKQSK